MAKLQNRHWVMISIGIICALFNILVFTLAPMDEVKGVFWVAYAFLMLAFVLTAVALNFIKLTKDTNFSTLFPLYVILGAYAGITFIVNLICMLGFAKGEVVTAPVLINIIVLAIASVAFIFTLMGVKHISNTSQVIDQKVKSLRALQVKVSTLEYSVSDPDVKKKIKALAESVRFSDPMGIPDTADAEAALEMQIDVVGQLIANGASSEDILSALEKADGQLKTRNALLRAMK